MWDAGLFLRRREARANYFDAKPGSRCAALGARGRTLLGEKRRG